MSDLYSYIDPDNNPLLVATKVSSFGGKQDYESGQDNGEFKGGGKSYDPATGWENPEPYAAVPPELINQGLVKYGDTIDVFNPQNPDNKMSVVVRDQGPAEKTGRGLDVAPHVLQRLGLDTDQQIGIDFTRNFRGDHENYGPGPNSEDELRAEFRDQIANQPPESMVAGEPTLAAVKQAAASGKPLARNPDGSLDYGGGVSVYPSGVIQAEAGNAMYQWFPGSSKPHIVNINPKSKLYRDQGTGITFDISDIKNPVPIDFSAQGDPGSVKLDDVKSGDWNSVPEGVRDVAKNIAEYKYPPLSGMALRSPYFQNMFKVISKVDPSFNYQEYQKRQKLLNDFAGEGKIGQNIINYNTALSHMANAKAASDELAKVYDADQISNYFAIHGSSIGGGTAYNNYLQNVDTLTNELSRAFSGAAPSEAEIKRNREGLAGGIGHIPNSNQRNGVMREQAKLLGGRLDAIEQAYERGFGKKPEFSLLTPEAEKTLRDIGAGDIADKFGTRDGKRPFVDPSNLSVGTTPLTGSQATPSNKVQARRNNATNKTEVMINGTWMPLDQVQGGQ